MSNGGEIKVWVKLADEVRELPIRCPKACVEVQVKLSINFEIFAQFESLNLKTMFYFSCFQIVRKSLNLLKLRGGAGESRVVGCACEDGYLDRRG